MDNLKNIESLDPYLLVKKILTCSWSLSTKIKDNIDMLLITETENDSSFPTAEFHRDGYTI